MAVDPSATFPDFVESPGIILIAPDGWMQRRLIRWHNHRDEYEVIAQRLVRCGLTFRDWTVTWYEAAPVTLRTYYELATWNLIWPENPGQFLPIAADDGYLDSVVSAIGYWRSVEEIEGANLAFRATLLRRSGGDLVAAWTLYILGTMAQIEVGRMLEKILHLKPPIIIA